MTLLEPVTEYLYLHDSCVDLYLKSIEPAMKEIPFGLLQVYPGCFPVICDYTNSQDSFNSGIVLGCGYHNSKDNHLYLNQGLVFVLNQMNSKIKNIKMFQTNHELFRSSFMINDYRYILTDKLYDLDKTLCRHLDSNEIHKL